MTDTERREWIRNASYEDLLRLWRFEPSGSPWFQGLLGDYFAEVMRAKRAQQGDEAHTAASKAIGWQR